MEFDNWWKVVSRNEEDKIPMLLSVNNFKLLALILNFSK